MANITDYPNGGGPHARAAGSNAAGMPAVTVFENTYDIDKGGVDQNDVLTEFMLIPAGSKVLGVQLEVIDIEATVTIDVGDSADPDGFVAAQVLAVAGRFEGAGAYTANQTVKGRYYAVDTYLSCTVAAADLVTGKFRVSVALANMG